MKWARVLGLAFMPAAVMAGAATDSLQDVDPSQSGYLPNHNMDPSNLVNFKLGWKNIYNLNEKFYAKPLVWTAPGSTNEQVIVVSNQNIIRMIDGATGALLKSRTLDAPFLATDASCGDIPNTIGITSTPWIDGATNIMYLISKGYKGSLRGTINGQYKMYGIDLLTLADVITPVSLENHYADNDHARYFVGGTLAQRPSLASIGDYIVAGFGGHCDKFNYTGMIVAISKTQGVGVTSIMAMEVPPGAPSPQALDITDEANGKAGIWQSGMGLSVEGNRVFFVTGNGRGGGDNAGGKPADGKKGQSTLQNAAVGLKLQNGVFVFADYFEPYEYQSLNGGDRDFGASGAAILDPMFSGGGINRVVVSGGKSGKIYIMDADNMGGFAMGASGSDNVIQTITQPNSLLGGIASYPAEGGYIYFCPSGDSLYAYKFGKDGSGKPFFTFAGKSAATFSGRAIPTVTSMNGTPGTGIVWMTDVNVGLVAYKAIPVNNVLVPFTLPATGRLQKMQRPGLGNSRVYTVTANQVLMIGPSSGVSSLNCNPAPLSFGSVTVGQTSTLQVTCQAVGSSYSMSGCTTGLGTFKCSGVPATVASGSSFTFPVVFNITNANIAAVRAGGFQVVPGAEGAAINIISSGGATLASVQASANVVASGAFLVAGNSQIDFGGITSGSSSAVFTTTLTNKGASVLTFTNFAYQDLKVSSPPYITITPGATTIIGNGFTSTGFPAINGQLAAGASITLSMTFTPSTVGSSSSLVTFYSDGGSVDVMLVGTSAQGPSTYVAPVSSKVASSSSANLISLTSVLPSSTKVSSSSSSSSPAAASSTTVVEDVSSSVASSVLSSITESSSVEPAPTPTPSKVLPAGAVIIPGGVNYAAPAGNFTDTKGDGGPLAGYVGYNITVQRISPPSEMTGVFECLGNCSSTAFGGPYTIAGVEDTKCFCANGTADTSSYGASFVMGGSYANGKISPREEGTGVIYIYTIEPVSSLPDAPPPPPPAAPSSSTVAMVSSSSIAPGPVAASYSSPSSSKTSSTSTSKSSSFSSSGFQTSTSKPASSSPSSSSSRTSSKPSSTIPSTSASASPSKSATLSIAKPTSSPTTAYPYIGCFADTGKSHAMPLLFKSKDMTPELCQSYVLSLAAKPTPTVLPYFFMEFASECYGGSTFNFGTSTTVKSLTGAKACTKVCSGSVKAISTGAAKCGGSKQFNLYAASGTVDFGGLPIVTASK